MTYNRLTSTADQDIPFISCTYKLTEIARYISINEDCYFEYVTDTDNVYFYKVFNNKDFIATLHLELQNKILYMDIVVFPEFQNKGFGAYIIKDVKNDVFSFNFEIIEVSIDESNIASIKLFEKMGFVLISKDDELLNYSYIK